MTGSPWPSDMVERLLIRKAEESGHPFLQYRDGDGELQAAPLEGGDRSIGRAPTASLVLGWDERVSRIHAIVQHVGGHWTVADDGLSRNGTFVNGERVLGTRRLLDRDVLQLGRTALVYRDPRGHDDAGTIAATSPGATVELSPAQRRVLAALCRPIVARGRIGTPATNEEIAREIFLSVDAVKAHLRILYRKFGIEELPQNQKRARLVALAVEGGLVGRD